VSGEYANPTFPDERRIRRRHRSIFSDCFAARSLGCSGPAHGVKPKFWFFATKSTLSLLKNVFGLGIGRWMIASEDYSCADQHIGGLRRGKMNRISGDHGIEHSGGKWSVGSTMAELEKTPKRPARKTRCAIYTRKSSEEGLEQAFNSLDAQREACAAYILSQKHEGWTVLPTQYDDGGFSGGTTERPALQRLIGDI